MKSIASLRASRVALGRSGPIAQAGQRLTNQQNGTQWPTVQKVVWMTPTLSAIAQTLMAVAITSTGLFWLSSVVGLWAAYDRSAASGRFGLITIGLLLIALLLYSTRRESRQESQRTSQRGSQREGSSAQSTGQAIAVQRVFYTIGMDSGLLAGGLGLLFLIGHNWQRATEQDFTLFHGLTNWIQHQQPIWGEEILLHENLVAGALMLLIPLVVVTLWQSWHQPNQPSRYWSLLGLTVGLITLLLTFSRGAWLGLVGGTLLAVYLHWRTDQAAMARRRRESVYFRAKRALRAQPSSGYRRLLAVAARGFDRLLDEYRLLDWAVAGGLFMGIIAIVGITVSPFVHDLLLRPIAGTYLVSTIDSRLAVWQDVLPLIQDYPLTGSGLGSTPMVLASYVYLLHVPYLNHAHNLYLQVAVEMGIPGLIGLLGLISSVVGLGVIWLRTGNRTERRLATGSLASLFALLFYSITDAELFVGLLVPLIFLPFALIISCAPWAATETETGQNEAEEKNAAIQFRWIFNMVGAAIPLLIILGLWFAPSNTLRWQLNLATVTQTRQELGLYTWPTWPIQDAVRRSSAIDSRRWIDTYESILVSEPTNVTAQRRLGQIMLSQGEYARGETLLTGAYQLAPQQRATRQLLGEAKALTGEPAAAMDLWRTVDVSQGQLDLRQWWHDYIGEEEQAAALAHLIEQTGR